MTFRDFLPLIAAIIANIVFVVLAYADYGRFTITILHLMFGVVPLILAIARLIKQSPGRQN